MAESVDRLSCRFADAEVWVLGNGPSLDEVDLTKLRRERTIGTNRILSKSGYEPGYILFTDIDIWKEKVGETFASDMMLASKSKFIVRRQLYETINETKLASPPKHKLPEDRTYLFEYSDAIRPAYYLYGPLFRGFLSGYYAAEIAYRMVWPNGTVVLAGMDLSYPDDGPSHAYGDGKVEFGCSDKHFPEAIDALVRLRDAARGSVQFFVVGNSALLEHGFESLPKHLLKRISPNSPKMP